MIHNPFKKWILNLSLIARIVNHTIQVVESKFDSAKGRDIKYMYLDACYDEDDDDSREAFDNSMEELYNLLEAFEGLETPTINQQACE